MHGTRELCLGGEKWEPMGIETISIACMMLVLYLTAAEFGDK